jgi:galactose mutarotase-like enzyme
MAKRGWTLEDRERDLYVEQIALGPGDVEGAAPGFSVTKRTLWTGLSRGVDVVEVDNGALRFVVVPTRGMGIWKASLGQLQLGWDAPAKGPVHPAFVPLYEPSGLGWLAGFDELLVRCGLESNGAPEFNDDGTLRHPLHGRIANIPAHKVEVTVDGSSGEIAVSGTVDEARLFGNKLRMVSTITTRIGRSGMTVSDTITNVSAEEGELELLYHINFGPPLAVPGSKVVLPAAKVVPRDAVAVDDLGQWDTCGPATPNLIESVFFIQLAAESDGRTQAMLCNPAGDRAVSLVLNKHQLPCLTLWKNRQAEADGYVTGLEPGTNFPNVKSFEKQHGRVVALQPGESRRFVIDIQLHPDTQSVRAAEQSISEIRRSRPPEVLGQPDPDWSTG